MMYLQNAKAVSKFLGCVPLFQVGANTPYGQIQIRAANEVLESGKHRGRPVFRSTSSLIDDYYRHTKKKKKRLSILQIAVNGVILFLLDEVGVSNFITARLRGDKNYDSDSTRFSNAYGPASISLRSFFKFISESVVKFNEHWNYVSTRPSK